MCHVSFDGGYEHVYFITVKEYDANSLLPFNNGRTETMHAVNYLHCFTVHKDRRQRALQCRKDSNVLIIFAIQPWRITRP